MVDVRCDPIGPVNRFIYWVYSGKRPRVLRRMVSILFHIELPVLQQPIRMAHPYGIIIIGPGAVVVNDVPPGVTVVGNPARQIHAGSGAK